MKTKLLIVSFLLTFFANANSTIVKNDYYEYELNVNDSCSVEYLNEDNSTVAITSPDGMSTFYIVCIKTGDYETVYTNDALETLDSGMFEILKQRPNKTDSYFWFSKEDHYYTLENGALCKTRVLLWNDKAGVLAGFSTDGNMEFIEKCLDDFKSPISLGKIATLIYVVILFFLFMIAFALWEDKKILAILYALVVIAGWYYFHWVLDFSVNRFILSYLG